MEYSVTVVQKGIPEFRWFKLKDVAFGHVYDPEKIFGIIHENDIYLRTVKNHFVRLEPLGNDYFLARDHFVDRNDPAYISGVMFGAVGAFIGTAVSTKDVFYLFGPDGQSQRISTGNIKKFLKEDEELFRKYKQIDSKGPVSPENQEMFILGMLRKQGKIPQD